MEHTVKETDEIAIFVSETTETAEDGEPITVREKYDCGMLVEKSCGRFIVDCEYDKKRRLTKILFNGKEFLSYGYMRRGGKYSFVLHDRFGKCYTYVTDSDGKLLSVKDCCGEIHFLYERGRLAEIRDKVQNIIEKYRYDSLGRCIETALNSVTVQNEFDVYGNKSKERFIFGNENDVVEYSYFSNGSAEGRTDKIAVSGFVESRVMDSAGRVTEIVRELGGGIFTEKYFYSDSKDFTAKTVYCSFNGRALGKKTLLYDRLKSTLSVFYNGLPLKSCTFDRLNRVTRERIGDKETVFTYDCNGNILLKIKDSTSAFSYDAYGEKLLAFGNEECEYDESDNLIMYRGMEFEWDGRGRLQSVFDGKNTAVYFYDARGERTCKIFNGKTTQYIFREGKLIREICGEKTVDYIYGHDGVIGFITGQKIFMYRKNFFGDVTHIIDDAGELVGEYSYGLLGECKILKDKRGLASENPLRFRGFYFDAESGLYYIPSCSYSHAEYASSSKNTVAETANVCDNSVSAVARTAFFPVSEGSVKGSATEKPFSGFASIHGFNTEVKQQCAEEPAVWFPRYYDPEAGRFISDDPVESGFVFNPVGNLNRFSYLNLPYNFIFSI